MCYNKDSKAWIYICCEKDLSFTKSVEASAFVLLEWYFSHHINRGKCFAHSDLM